MALLAFITQFLSRILAESFQNYIWKHCDHFFKAVVIVATPANKFLLHTEGETTKKKRADDNVLSDAYFINFKPC